MIHNLLFAFWSWKMVSHFEVFLGITSLGCINQTRKRQGRKTCDDVIRIDWGGDSAKIPNQWLINETHYSHTAWAPAALVGAFRTFPSSLSANIGENLSRLRKIYALTEYQTMKKQQKS